VALRIRILLIVYSAGGLVLGGAALAVLSTLQGSSFTTVAAVITILGLLMSVALLALSVAFMVGRLRTSVGFTTAAAVVGGIITLCELVLVLGASTAPSTNVRAAHLIVVVLMWGPVLLDLYWTVLATVGSIRLRRDRHRMGETLATSASER